MNLVVVILEGWAVSMYMPPKEAGVTACVSRRMLRDGKDGNGGAEL